MKAKELQVDDLVNSIIDIDGKRVLKPERVKGIRTDGGEYIQTNTTDVWYSIDTYEAIPVTPEILEKNGFVLKPDGWLWCEDKDNEEQDYIFIQFRKGCDGVRICELGFVNKVQARFRQINDVHELQHALRLFRINKDIVL